MKANPWHALVALASSLSEQGQLVTVIRTTSDNTPESWAHGDNGAHILAGDRDVVVTSDGSEYPIDGAANE